MKIYKLNGNVLAVSDAHLGDGVKRQDERLEENNPTAEEITLANYDTIGADTVDSIDTAYCSIDSESGLVIYDKPDSVIKSELDAKMDKVRDKRCTMYIQASTLIDKHNFYKKKYNSSSAKEATDNLIEVQEMLSEILADAPQKYGDSGNEADVIDPDGANDWVDSIYKVGKELEKMKVNTDDNISASLLFAAVGVNTSTGKYHKNTCTHFVDTDCMMSKTTATSGGYTSCGVCNA